MATAKIATLAIRTLAKPIAAQIKHQAQSHQRFRSVCISLAQFMHRTEMALRSNLLATPGSSSSSSSGEKAKVRPLNEAKAVTNGANALAEGFLFALAVGLILGENYRSSRSRAKQRDRTEDGLEELSMAMRALAEKIGIDYDIIERRVGEMKSEQQVLIEKEEESTNMPSKEGTHGDGGGEEDAASLEAKHAADLRRARERIEADRDRLQHAVNVLLRLALKSGWIAGEEGLHLRSILDGTDDEREKPPSSQILQQVAQARAEKASQ